MNVNCWINSLILFRPVCLCAKSAFWIYFYLIQSVVEINNHDRGVSSVNRKKSFCSEQWLLFLSRRLRGNAHISFFLLDSSHFFFLLVENMKVTIEIRAIILGQRIHTIINAHIIHTVPYDFAPMQLDLSAFAVYVIARPSISHVPSVI